MTDSSEPEPVQRTYDAAATDATPLAVEAAADLAEAVLDNVETVIVGKREAAKHLVTALLGRGHVLLEDVPGVGKTMLARTIARSVAGEFSRVQFTPDLLPADVTGVTVYDEAATAFEFRPGPLFGNVVLADEINRAPPKTQSALLEGMAEGQVTTDGETRRLPDPFVVIATQNAVERDRTYELPVAELDRFMKQVSLGYPDREDELAVLERIVGGHPIDDVEAVTDVEHLRRARATAAAVTVAPEIREYVTDLARHTREHTALGASPRASIDLVQAAQARAILDRRDYVLPDDVREEVHALWGHRIVAEESGPVGGDPGADAVAAALADVPVR